MSNFRLPIFDCRLPIWCTALICLAGVGGALWVARGQEAKPDPGPGSTTVDPLTEIKVVQKVRTATTNALEYLRKKQKPDGSWEANTAMNALALLAFMGRGHVPG